MAPLNCRDGRGLPASRAPIQSLVRLKIPTITTSHFLQDDPIQYRCRSTSVSVGTPWTWALEILMATLIRSTDVSTRLHQDSYKAAAGLTT
jgi:hypothetical protein